MATVDMHLHLSEKAAQLLEKYCSSRTRGAFLSDLVIAYDRQQMDGQGVIESLRREAADAARRADQAANALRAVEQLRQMPSASVNQVSSPRPKSKKRR